MLSSSFRKASRRLVTPPCTHTPLRRKFSIVTAIQDGMVGLQASTGLPWYMTFALASMSVRVALFPLVRSRFIIGQNMSKSIPELNALYKMLIRRLRMIPATHVEERTRICGIFFEGVRSSLALHSVNVQGMFAYPIATVICFGTFFYSLRGMITQEHTLSRGEEKQATTTTTTTTTTTIADGEAERPKRRSDLGLSQGGLLWFPDLTRPDRSTALPAISVMLTYAALELGSQTGAVMASRRLTLPRTIVGFFQGCFIFGFPILATLPTGVFCYWIPGSLVSMAQTVAMRSPVFLRAIGIKALK